MANNTVGISSMLPVPDMSAAIEIWEALLGVPPTFVDSGRWAQFDVEGRRLVLAGTDRTSEAAGVMIKVIDLQSMRKQTELLGLDPSAITEGYHELRFSVVTPGGWPAVFYQAKKA